MSDARRQTGLDLLQIRSRLEAEPRRQWRALEEAAGTEEFLEYLKREFPQNASEWLDPAGRREFLKLMGASLALAGVTACTRQPSEVIVPYVRAAEEIIPGRPLYFATAVTLGGYAQGVLVENHMGRPTKIEGNPEHPASLGATDLLTQAAVLNLYDPDRSQVVLRQGNIAAWTGFLNELAAALQRHAASGGAGLHLLTETVTSPTLAALIGELLARHPRAVWHQYEPVSHDAGLAGAMLAFGQPVSTRYQLDRADVIVALDADFMACGAGSVRYARDVSARRRAGTASMNRLYVVETTPSPTGATADHRLALSPAGIVAFARALAAELEVNTGGAATAADPAWQRWVTAVAADLRRVRGACAVLAGPQQPAVVHALAHAINDRLGNVGATVVHTDPVEARPEDHVASLADLTRRMEAGQVGTLLIVGGNPAYNAPAGIPFAQALARVPFTAHLGLHEDETAARCLWHIPEAHELEAWGDTRAYDGTVTIQQPLIAPLYPGCRSAVELLSALLGRATVTGHDAVRAHWSAARPGTAFEAFWKRALHDGVVADTALPPRAVTLRAGEIARAVSAESARADGLEVAFRPDPGVWDGRFANNGWLQELPRPLTTLTWDNAAHIAPATAQRLGLRNEDVVELTLEGRSVAAPVWIVPGMADGTVALWLGYGRERAGRVGTGRGHDVYRVLPGSPATLHAGAQVRPTGERFPLACAQGHHSMEGRDLVRWAPLETYRKSPDFAQHMGHAAGEEHVSLYRDWKYEGHAWGMSIDLGACHGCNACVIACQSENNVPVVGKDQVILGREMHWLRVDRYFEGNLDDPMIHHQPLPCMHCENAPCEPVCPVAATVHDGEGLNQMVYNRCVGTRYCGNNCPYKVRRFNFLLYQDWQTPSLKLMRNPDVTVRSRGVMEKCTYCVQRINAARIQSEVEDRRIQDGEVTPACAAACPTQAIVFGDINDPESRVRRLKEMPLDYGLLTDLNTRPRTTYLARVTNPNPELAPARPSGSEDHTGHGEG
jgi:molybdopterin-containing oxidoreductase family iron-sulfur binding subunit